MEQDQWVMDQLAAEAVSEDLVDMLQHPPDIVFALIAGKK